MNTVDLHRLRLRPGETREIALEIEPKAFMLGGQPYEASPTSVPADLEVAQAWGGMVFQLRFRARLSGPCMRCLGHAEVDADVSARELHDAHSDPDDDLRSEYVADDTLDLAAWAHDAIALALPDQILCRPECAGLCPVCGKDLNVEPHEHAEVGLDPRWAPLEELRESL